MNVPVTVRNMIAILADTKHYNGEFLNFREYLDRTKGGYHDEEEKWDELVHRKRLNNSH